MAEPIDVEQTLSLFERVGKIRLAVTSEVPVKLVMLEILNWHRYQSEYQRQKKYRSKGLQGGLQKSDSRSYNKGYTVEGGEEGEEEEEAAATFTPAKHGHPLWELVKVMPESLPYGLVELCEGLYATKKPDQSLYEFMGVCMDAWELQGHKIPRSFAQAKASLRDTPPPQAPFPVAESEPWGQTANCRAGGGR